MDLFAKRRRRTEAPENLFGGKQVRRRHGSNRNEDDHPLECPPLDNAGPM
jgi:hypothetical protein